MRLELDDFGHLRRQIFMKQQGTMDKVQAVRWTNLFNAILLYLAQHSNIVIKRLWSQSRRKKKFGLARVLQPMRHDLILKGYLRLKSLVHSNFKFIFSSHEATFLMCICKNALRRSNSTGFGVDDNFTIEEKLEAMHTPIEESKYTVPQKIIKNNFKST
jgi:hypothetical protein